MIAYASCVLNSAKCNYSATKLKCLAVQWGIRRTRDYLEGYRFKMITDHQSLKWLQKLESPTGRLGWWVFEIQHNDFKVQYKKSLLNKVVDALSRQNNVNAVAQPQCS